MLATGGWATGSIATWGWTPSAEVTPAEIVAPGWTPAEQRRVQTIELAIHYLGNSQKQLLDLGRAQSLISLQARKIQSINIRTNSLWEKLRQILQERQRG